MDCIKQSERTECDMEMTHYFSQSESSKRSTSSSVIVFGGGVIDLGGVVAGAVVGSAVVCG